MQPFDIAWTILKDSARYRPELDAFSYLQSGAQMSPAERGLGPVVPDEPTEMPPPQNQKPKLPDVKKPFIAPRAEDAPGGPNTLTHALYNPVPVVAPRAPAGGE